MITAKRHDKKITRNYSQFKRVYWRIQFRFQEMKVRLMEKLHAEIIETEEIHDQFHTAIQRAYIPPETKI